MRRRIILLAALAALAACAQNDQSFPVEPESNAPVTGVMGASATTVSTAAGVSLTVPAGALQAGSKITVAHVDASTAGGLPVVGDAYLVSFDGVPTKDPTVTFSFTANEQTTAGALAGTVPIVLRVGTPGMGLRASRHASLVASDFTSPLDKFQDLLDSGLLAGMNGSGTTLANTLTGHQRDLIASLLEKLDTTLPANPPFSDVEASTPWYNMIVNGTTPLQLATEFGSIATDTTWQMLPPTIGLPSLDPSIAEQFSKGLSGGGSVYMIFNVLPSFLAARGIVPLPSNNASSYPLIPAGSTSATFELVCTGMHWPGADALPLCSNNTIDVRVGAELLHRFPASLVIPNYLMGEVTLGVDGSATGTVKYDMYLRSLLSSGITGVQTDGTYNVSGSWSVRGDTLTAGGYDFRYETPDAQTLILSVADSVQIKNNDGTKSWEPVQANVKLTRK